MLRHSFLSFKLITDIGNLYQSVIVVVTRCRAGNTRKTIRFNVMSFFLTKGLFGVVQPPQPHSQPKIYPFPQRVNKCVWLCHFLKVLNNAPGA